MAVEEHLGLVHLCAKRFHPSPPLEYEDLFQAGCVGLCKAAERFEAERGLQFSTYAVPVILGELRAVFRAGGAVHVSRGMQEVAQRAKAAEEALGAELGRTPTLTEVAEALQETVERTAQALGALTPPLSFSLEDGEELAIPTAAPEEQICEHMALRECLRALAPQDQALIHLRYFQHKTQTETAQALHMTQVQVSRREKKILLWLRRAMEGQ